MRGARNYDEIKTINGIVHSTFQSTCSVLGLLGDHKEWHEVLNEASFWTTSSELRLLFATLIISCKVIDPDKLF